MFNYNSKLMVSNLDEKVSKNELDIISELPDPILGKILSCLPTKNAVAASILSTRWKHIFPLELPLINIDLDESLLLHPKENESKFVSTSFIDFVDKLLNQMLRTLRKVSTFTLRCEKPFFHEDQLGSWVGTLVQLGVRELCVDCYMGDTCAFRYFSYTALTKLVVKKNVNYDVGVAIHIYRDLKLPNLITLDLSKIFIYVDIHGVDTEDCELSAFVGYPALKELSLTDCDLRSLYKLRIISSVLKTLSIKNSLPDDVPVIINTPNLELLGLSNHVAHNYRIYPFNSLRLGHIDVEPWYYESVRDLVYDCRTTRHLYLALSSIQHLPYANKRLPEFLNLTRLFLTSVRSEGWVVLACILNNAPNLEQLTFEEEFEQGNMGFADFTQQVVPSPPTCLELHLKTVEFTHPDFAENTDALHLLYYFVRHGKVLEKITLNGSVFPIER